ncbi:hypothetical protein ACCS87_02765 [Rhizobium ruizarguesonis]|uniref:hypothetical protein n=1 Tax=Rhizobium sp. WYCCWR 11146 TaxID=2749833 RepID=UPI0015E764E4|nr:hypothetical protein [Rhizobium sp. WYCCWR 11146]MBA1345964.1 hypothetical protein [Rhizobium sp. WYCCWR 11146]
MRNNEQATLDAFVSDLRKQLKVPDGEDWHSYLPENGRGDRIFSEWQRLAVAARNTGATK